MQKLANIQQFESIQNNANHKMSGNLSVFNTLESCVDKYRRLYSSYLSALQNKAIQTSAIIGVPVDCILNTIYNLPSFDFNNNEDPLVNICYMIKQEAYEDAGFDAIPLEGAGWYIEEIKTGTDPNSLLMALERMDSELGQQYDCNKNIFGTVTGLATNGAWSRFYDWFNCFSDYQCSAAN